jgi:hypothetical protein
LRASEARADFDGLTTRGTDDVKIVVDLGAQED